MKWIKYKVNFHLCRITSWSDTKTWEHKGIVKSPFSCRMNLSFQQSWVSRHLFVTYISTSPKNIGCGVDIWLLPSGKIRWPNLMKWIGHKVNYLGKTKRLLSHHFFVSWIHFFQQRWVSRQLFAQNISESWKNWVWHGHLAGPMPSGKKKITKFHEMDY